MFSEREKGHARELMEEVVLHAYREKHCVDAGAASGDASGGAAALADDVRSDDGATKRLASLKALLEKEERKTVNQDPTLLDALRRTVSSLTREMERSVRNDPDTIRAVVNAEIDAFEAAIRTDAHLVRHSISLQGSDLTTFESAVKWWAENKSKYPLCAAAAARFMPVPGSTAGVESSWSLFSAVRSSLRNSMKGETACDNALLYMCHDIVRKPGVLTMDLRKS